MILPLTLLPRKLPTGKRRGTSVGGRRKPTSECSANVEGEVGSVMSARTSSPPDENKKSLDKRTHGAVVQTKAERREKDAVQGCHWTISLLKRWLLGTHAGAVGDKHLQAYLDEFALRHNRRKTKGVGRIAARVIENLVARPPRTMRMLVDETKRCRWYGSVQRTV